MTVWERYKINWQRRLSTFLVAVALGCLVGLCVDLTLGFQGIGILAEVAGAIGIGVSVGYAGIIKWR